MTAAKSSLKRNMPTLLILIVSGALIYALPYFRYYYYDAFVKLFNISNTQMGALGSAFGGTAIIGYMIGGFFADRLHLSASAKVGAGRLTGARDPT